MWKQLDELKSVRERNAWSAVRATRAREEVARSDAEAAIERLAAHHRTTEAAERALYAGLMSRLVRLRDFDDVHLSIAAMRQREQALDESRARAAQDLSAAERATAEAHARHLVARRAREKFVELISMHEQEAAQEALRREDAEIEEAASQRPTPEDIE